MYPISNSNNNRVINAAQHMQQTLTQQQQLRQLQSVQQLQSIQPTQSIQQSAQSAQPIHSVQAPPYRNQQILRQPRVAPINLRASQPTQPIQSVGPNSLTPASHDQQQQQHHTTTIQLPLPSELEPHQTTHSWTIRGFQDLTKLMHGDAFIYSDRFKSPRDSDYVWRMKVYPNRYQNEVSLFLEAIQTPFEKKNCFVRRNNIEFHFSVYQLLKDSSSTFSSSNDNNNIDNCSSSASTSSFLTSPSVLKDSSKETPRLVYVSDRFKWNFDLQGQCGYWGIHSIGTFQDLFQNHVNNGVGSVGQKRIKIEEDVNIFIRVHIHTYTKPQLQDYYRDFDANSSNSFILAMVEFIFNEQDNYDVVNKNIDFISDNSNSCPTSSSPSSPSSSYTSSPSNIRTIKAHKVLLSQRSEYFDSMFKSGYKESTMKRIPIKKIYINADMMRLEHLAKLTSERLSYMINHDTWDQLLKITWRSNIAPASRLQLKKVILEYVYKNWSFLKATESMKNLISTSSIENIEELMETKMFDLCGNED
ncbi:11755_t:CDS:2 [Entrophospora sp. SA101]|nr:11755_t:CDS:2 [Entrophospora sp. SA101]